MVPKLQIRLVTGGVSGRRDGRYSPQYFQRGMSNSTSYVRCALLLDSTLEYCGF